MDQARLETTEARFIAGRARPADLAGAFAEAWAPVGAGEPQLRDVGMAIVQAIDAEAAAAPELPYHNRHHVSEALLAMGQLGVGAQARGVLDPHTFALSLAALAGHDWLHGGAPPDGGITEARAADAVDAMARLHGASDQDRARLRFIILGTDPARVADNVARASGAAPAGEHGPALDTAMRLVNEADVFASFLPDLGPALAGLLAQEWRSVAPEQAERVASHAGRLGFLRMYGAFSPEAEALGLGACRAVQLDAYARIGNGDADAGAATLDALPPAEATERLRAARRELAAER